MGTKEHWKSTCQKIFIAAYIQIIRVAEGKTDRSKWRRGGLRRRDTTPKEDSTKLTTLLTKLLKLPNLLR